MKFGTRLRTKFGTKFGTRLGMRPRTKLGAQFGKTKLLSLLLFSASAFAADTSITGTWAIDGNVQGTPVPELCKIVQTENKLSGTCKNGDKITPITGSVDGKKITISHPGEYQGDPLTITFAGTLNDGGVIVGNIDVEPQGYYGTFTAKKAEAELGKAIETK